MPCQSSDGASDNPASMLTQGHESGRPGPFDTITLQDLQRTLSTICDTVVKHRGRIEIVACGPAPDVVLISKCELAYLDHALEILSGSQNHQKACNTIKHLARSDLGDCSARHKAGDDRPNLAFLNQLLS